MTPRIGRTLPPAAAPLKVRDLLSGFGALLEGGKAVRRFEEDLRAALGIRHCFAVSSGKAALVLILRTLRTLCPERDEVLIPGYTCYSVPSAIVRAGLKVRVCDVKPGTLDFDFDRLEVALENPRLLCVIPTHLYGWPAKVERVKDLAVGRGLFVVEDAAQALGGEWHGRKLGTRGDVGFFSLGRGKAVTTVEGGVIVTDDDSIGSILEKEVTALPGYGMGGVLALILYAVALTLLLHPWRYWLPKSLPFLGLGETRFDPGFPILRLSSFQAGLARRWRARYDAFNRMRTLNSSRLSAYGLAPAGGQGMIPGLLRFPVLLPDAEKKRDILRASEKEGLGIADGYPGAIDTIAELGLSGKGVGCPGAKDLADRLVCLPVHPYVREEDIHRIAELLRIAC